MIRKSEGNCGGEKNCLECDCYISGHEQSENEKLAFSHTTQYISCDKTVEEVFGAVVVNKNLEGEIN